MSKIAVEKIAKDRDGTDILCANIDLGSIRAALFTYGGRMSKLEVPDKTGSLRDVLLGYDTIESYFTDPVYMSALIGRSANRIANSRFKHNGIDYHLHANEGKNQLHGGPDGFHNANWELFELKDEENACSIELRKQFPAGQSGFPGRMDCSVIFHFSAEQAIRITFSAKSNADTVFCPTYHPYFNLGSSDSILDHELLIPAKTYTETDSENLPTGVLLNTSETAFDFQTMKELGVQFNSHPDKLANGLDHNFIPDKANEMGNKSILKCVESGIRLEVSSDMPGIQVYTAGGFDGIAGKNGLLYSKFGGIALEPQFYPDAVNQPNFPFDILKAGTLRSHHIQYQFYCDI